MATKEVQNAAPTTTLEGKRSPRSSIPTWLWLTAPITFLVAIAAGVGFFVEDLYRDTPLNAAQALGQDLITLVVALPTLLISAILAARGFRRAHMVFKFMVNLCHLMRISQAKLINPAYKGSSSLIMSDVLYRARILLRRS